MTKMYNKAITALVVGLVMMFVQQFGITESTSFVDALTTLLTSGLVFMVPNKQPEA